MKKMEEEELRRFLADLRRGDEASAPTLREILARTRASRPSAVAPRAVWIAAGMSIVALAAVVLLLHRPGREDPLLSAARLARWESPTDSLLRTPGGELLSSGADLTTPLPDYSSALNPADRRTPSRSP